MIKFHCRICSKKLGVPDDYAHKRVRCPECRSTNLVPDVVVTASHPGGVAHRSAGPGGRSGWFSTRQPADPENNGESSYDKAGRPMPHPSVRQPSRPTDPGETVTLPSIREPGAPSPRPAGRKRRYRLLRTCAYALTTLAALFWLAAAAAPAWTLVQLDLRTVPDARLAWWLTAGASGGMVLGGIGCFAAAQALFVLRDLATATSGGPADGGT